MDLSASHNGIQALQDEENTRNEDLPEAREEVVEACNATEREHMQLNWDRMRFCEPQDERESFAAFIDRGYVSVELLK